MKSARFHNVTGYLNWQSVKRLVFCYNLQLLSVLQEQSVTFGSHQFLDRLALAFHLAVAARLTVAPDLVLRQARENLNHWLKLHTPESRTGKSLREWQKLIESHNLRVLLAKMTEDTDEGQRLRQSSPFVGVLSPQEREELISLCEKVTTA